MTSPGRAKALIAAAACVWVLVVSAAHATTFTVLYSFQNDGKDGYFPSAGLTSVGGILYGTSQYGGTGNCINGCGTIFSVDPATGAESVLYSLRKHRAQAGGLLAVAGKFLGTASGGGRREEGSIFSFDFQTGVARNHYYFCQLYDCADGANPTSPLIDSKGVIYGTTYAGGTGNACEDDTYGCGTVFSFDRTRGAETALYSFCSQANCTDGANPFAGVVESDGTLYGATAEGGQPCTGSYGCGVVFSLNPATGAEETLYTFCKKTNCLDGRNPQGGMIKAGKDLYGTAILGGNGGTCEGYAGCGVVFSVNPARKSEKVVYSFQSNGSDGEEPEGSLVEVSGILYGTTYYGGTAGNGTVFSVDPATGTETVLNSFCGEANCTDGASPGPDLLNVNGVLYGVTYVGGTGTCQYYTTYGCGTVFAITP